MVVVAGMFPIMMARAKWHKVLLSVSFKTDENRQKSAKACTTVAGLRTWRVPLGPSRVKTFVVMGISKEKQRFWTICPLVQTKPGVRKCSALFLQENLHAPPKLLVLGGEGGYMCLFFFKKKKKTLIGQAQNASFVERKGPERKRQALAPKGSA